ncbi:MULTISPECIES: GntR family transcriptional regulator [Asanoa]|uniref:Helix-turn-helix domain-containing protein n=2 Tax=Asanoa TaxID=195964 RepID=A0A239PGQ9_9ACTN|nr:MULTISPECIES: GntR family transcriptional regulator [Asanoa]GIF74227.1 hypothetical protein Asi02nite_37450 [Asanoa siamensis]SNT66263.1 Helix-turn-helix domain-containing protein [Asanoa hainanensis]
MVVDPRPAASCNGTPGANEHGTPDDGPSPGDGTAYLAWYTAHSGLCDDRPRPTVGQLLWIGRAASVQFALEPFPFWLLQIHSNWSTYDGWIWLDGDQLDDSGEVVLRRTIWVQLDGIRLAPAGHPGNRRAWRPAPPMRAQYQPRRTRWSAAPPRGRKDATAEAVETNPLPAAATPTSGDNRTIRKEHVHSRIAIAIAGGTPRRGRRPSYSRETGGPITLAGTVRNGEVLPWPPHAVAALRATTKMSRAELAACIGFTRRQVSHWERGSIQPSRLARVALTRLLRALGPADRHAFATLLYPPRQSGTDGGADRAAAPRPPGMSWNAEAISALRQVLELTCAGLGALISVSQPTVSRWENSLHQPETAHQQALDQVLAALPPDQRTRFFELAACPPHLRPRRPTPVPPVDVLQPLADDLRPLPLRIADQLADAITAGHYPPGTQMPTGERIAAHYGVSLATTSRAIRHLSRRGLIEVLPQRRTLVSPLGSVGVPGVKQDPIRLPHFPRQNR